MSYNDRNGIPIQPGDRIMWHVNGSLRVSDVIRAPNYEGGIRCGGLSIAAVIDDSDKGVEIINSLSPSSFV